MKNNLKNIQPGKLRAVWHPTLHRLVVMDADLLKFIKNALNAPKNARAGKVASVPAREGMPPCQVYAKVGKRQFE